MKHISLISGAILGVVAATPVQAGVTWNFNYELNSGWYDTTLYNGTTLGQARQSVLEQAGDYLSGFLTAYNAVIEMDVDDDTTTPGTLAAAGSNFNFGATAGFVEIGDIQRKILTGVDADPSKADGNVTWNFTTELWELGTDFQPGEYDFLSTAIHELTHALGFSSEILEDGSDGYGNAPGDPGNWSPFDEFLTDFAGTEIIDPASYILNKTEWDLASLSMDGDGTSGCGAGLLFTGANAVAANGGQAVQIYSPDPWEGGSSGSHLDDNCYTAPGDVSHFMMEAQTIDGLGIRTLSALEVGMMRDIGYTQFGVQASGVPVPAPLYLVAGALVWLGVGRRMKAA